MLQAIRDRATGLIGWVIGMFIIIPFALWGIQQYFGGGSSNPLARVNGLDITPEEFESFHLNYRQQELQRLQRISGSALTAGMINRILSDERTRKNAMDILIQRKALLFTVLQSGYEISDAQLAQAIQGVDAFQVNGRFDRQSYEQQLRNQGMTPPLFETRLRRQLIVQQPYDGVVNSEFITPAELATVIRLQEQKREIGYLVIPYSRYEKDVQIDAAVLGEYYGKYAERFRRPEQVSIRYIELSREAIAKQIDVNEESLRAYYEKNIDEYKVKDTSKSLVKAQKILEKIRAGESFEALARKYSEDAGSKENGGDLDYIVQNTMDKAFEDVLFSMKKGEVSEPVLSKFGYHIIQLTDIRGDERRASHILIKTDPAEMRTLSFEDTRSRVEEAYREFIAEERFIEQAETLAILAYEFPDNLEEASNQLGLKIMETPLFDRQGGTGIAANPKIVDAAFLDDVLKESRNSDPVEVAPDHLVVLRVREHVPARTPEMDEIREELTRNLRRDTAVEAAQQQGLSIIEQASGGEPIESIAAQLKVEWKATGLVGRNEKDIASAILNAAFSSPRPTGDSPVYGGAALPSGDYAVFGVISVVDGASDKLDPKRRRSISNRLVAAAGQRTLENYLREIRNSADIEVFPQQRDP